MTPDSAIGLAIVTVATVVLVTYALSCLGLAALAAAAWHGNPAVVMPAEEAWGDEAWQRLAGAVTAARTDIDEDADVRQWEAEMTS